MTTKNDNHKEDSKSSFRVYKRCSESSEASDSVQISTRKEVTITIENIENIDRCKVKEIMVKMEFAGRVIAESDRISVKNNTVDVDLVGVIFTEELTPEFLDDILANPVLITVTDCTPPTEEIPPPPPPKPEKETKPKTSKKNNTPVSVPKTQETTSNILGICNLDIGGLVLGKKNIRETLAVEVEQKLIAQEIISWFKLPKLTIFATTGNEKLVPERQSKEYNVIGITVESVYNPPSYITEGTLFDASVPLCRFGDKNGTIVFPNGIATFITDMDCRKKWLTLPQLEGRGGRSKNEIVPAECEVLNTLPCKVHIEEDTYRQVPRIQWNTFRNCLLTKPDVHFLTTKLMKHHVWPIEVSLAKQSSITKTTKPEKKSKPSTSTFSANNDHFTAFLNLSSLLYPGVTRVRVAAQLYTYSQTDLMKKFGVEFNAPASQPSGGTAKSKAVSERSKVSMKELEEGKGASGTPVLTAEGLPVYIIVEIELWKPLTPKREPEYLEEELKNYVSIKGKTTKKTMSLEIAKENFSLSIKNAVSLFVEDYQNFVQMHKENQSEPEDFDHEFHKYLCKRETFHKIRNCLESKAISLVIEKFGNLSQYNEMLPEIYVYLVEEMHNILNNSICGQKYVPSPHFNTNELYLYAEEAIEEEDFNMAKNYLLLRISRDKYNPDYWLDYAAFCVRIGDFETAAEATREALSLNFNHQMALTMYGLIMDSLNNGTIAELAFQVLLSKYPDFVEGWMILHCFYSKFNNFEGLDVTLQMAARLEYCKRVEEVLENNPDLDAEEFCFKNYRSLYVHEVLGDGKYGMASYEKGKSWTDPLCWTTLLCPPNSINIKAAVLMLKLGFHEYASMALSQEPYTEHSRFSAQFLYYLAVSHYLQGRYNEAIVHLESAAKEYGKDCSIWALMGHAHYKLEDHVNAISCFEYVMETYNRPDDIHLIYLRMGNYYLQTKKYACAKQTFITACKYSPSPRLWIGVGMACLQLDEFEDAETAFCEANYLDNRDAETWGYLALANALLLKIELAQHCYTEAKKRNLSNLILIDKIEASLGVSDFEGEA